MQSGKNRCIVPKFLESGSVAFKPVSENTCFGNRTTQSAMLRAMFSERSLDIHDLGGWATPTLCTSTL